MSVLQGPSTNVLELQAALKAAAMLAPTCLPAKLYTSAGAELDLRLECAAVCEPSTGAVVIRAQPPASVVFSASSRPSPAVPSRSGSDAALRRHIRQRHCFLTGLAIQQAINRRGDRSAAALAVAVDARTAARVVAEAMKANVLLRCMDALRGNG